MISIRVQADNIGFGILDNGNVGILANDHGSGLIVITEFSPEAWREFLKNAPRLKGVGVSLPSNLQGVRLDNGSDA